MTAKQKTHFRIGLTGLIAGAIVFVILNAAFSPYKSSANPAIAQTVTSPHIPEEVTFCNEPVPIAYFDVFESLERELLVNTYFHSQTSLNIKNASRYFPVIEPILRKYNIPDDFKYLAVAESGLRNVVSPAGARGFWQILEGTAKDYGLEVSNEVDERYHVEKATEAACKYLLDSYEYYNDWTLVAASYNVGRRGVNRQIDRQGEETYYDLLLNDETARYVFRIIAIKLVMENPSLYGFEFSKKDLYRPVPHRVVTVSSSIPDLAEFAKEQQCNYKLLKYLNPWLREKTLTIHGNREYMVKIPTKRER